MSEYEQIRELFEVKFKSLEKQIDGHFQKNDKEHQEIKIKQDYTNGTVKVNKEWIDIHKTDIDDVIMDRKNFIGKMFDFFWKSAIGAIGVFLGINWFK